MPLATALASRLTDSGVDVIDIGLCGAEMVYSATLNLKTDGGIMVTASHNPADYNGMKLVRELSKPISGDAGLNTIKDLVIANKFDKPGTKGEIEKANIKPQYIAHLLKYVGISHLKPLKIVTNAGNGCAGPIIDALEKLLPFKFIKVHNKPDGTFPNGIPHPLLPENREDTTKTIKKHNADIGLV